MYNYKISKSRPGKNWFMLKTLDCLAWKSHEIQNYVTTVALNIDVIFATDTIDNAAQALKEVIELTIENCDIWDFDPVSFEEFNFNSLPEDITVFSFELTLWVEMPELIVEYLNIQQFPTEIPLMGESLPSSLEPIKSYFCINYEETPPHLQKDDGVICIDLEFDFKTQKVKIVIMDCRLQGYGDPVSESENISVIKTVSLTKELIQLLKNPCEVDKLCEYLKCTN